MSRRWRVAALLATATSILVGLYDPRAVAGGAEGELESSPSRYSDVPIGLQQNVPQRPRPLIDLFNGFVEDGPFEYEYKLPTGMVLLPNFIVYATNRLGVSARDDGIKPATVEVVDVLNVAAALHLNNTERVVWGMEPFHTGGRRTRYEIQPDGRWDEHFNYSTRFLFYEGEIDGLLPLLDWDGTRPVDIGFSVGRQPIVDHDGFLIGDTFDTVALTKGSIPFPGSSWARITALYGWGMVNRGANNRLDRPAKLYGLLGSADVAHSTIDLGGVYVGSEDGVGGDQANVALSAEQEMHLFGQTLDTTFRVATSWTPHKDTAYATTGTVLFASVSFPPRGTSNILYANVFGAIDDYAPAARAAGFGGPLGRTGLLFSANQLTSSPSPIDNVAREAFGGAVGYQMFFDGVRRQWIVEVGGRLDERGKPGFDSLGMATRIEQAIGRHVFVSVDGYGILQGGEDDAIGMRSEINIAF